MLRPAAIDELPTVLERLVSYGGAMVPEPWRQWLTCVGAARPAESSGWMTPNRRWLHDVLPVKDSDTLIRRTAIRDPLYRLHLDICLASVIHAIGVAGRWQRLEDVVLGPCRKLAPRVLQLLNWQASHTNKPPGQVSQADWGLAEESVLNGCRDSFRCWDTLLWGETRGAGDLFQLFQDLYLPIADQPVHFDSVFLSGMPADTPFLQDAVLAASDGDGLVSSNETAPTVQRLQDCGVPIRRATANGSHAVAFLVLPVTISLDQPPQDRSDTSTVPARVPNAARRSTAIEPQENVLCFSLWRQFENNANTIVFASIQAKDSRWPDDVSPDRPDWLPLPGLHVLSQSSFPVTASPDVEPAVLQLAEHPFYGMLLQLLLLEALDRELGEETLILAPPLGRKVENIEAATRLLYRPREDVTNREETRKRRFLALGGLDQAVGQLARHLGVSTVAAIGDWSSSAAWSRALALMHTAQLIVGRHDRWELATHFIDRLHSGILMKDVIRRGRAVRDRMHAVLSGMWHDTARAGTMDEVKV